MKSILLKPGLLSGVLIVVAGLIGCGSQSKNADSPAALLLAGLAGDQAWNPSAYALGPATPTGTRVYGQFGAFTSNAGNNGGLSANSISGPYSVTTDSSGNAYIADTNNNRVLYYPSGSTTATRVYGQPDFVSNSANRGGGPAANTLSGPAAVAVDSSGDVYIADLNNNRVLYYAGTSTTATRVYGQGGVFTTAAGNKGGSVTAATLSGPRGVGVDSSGDVYIADTNNNRVLYYAGTSTTATRVYGQSGVFTTAAGNKGGSVTAATLSGPFTVALDSSDNVYIADVNNNRVLYYAGTSTTATRVYGQGGVFTTAAGNKGGSVTAGTLSAPYSVAIDSSDNVYIADTNNNRVLYYPSTLIDATVVFGQFGSLTGNAGNSGGSVTANTLSGPYAVSVDDSGNVYVADTNNNRVLRYPSSGAARVYGQFGVFTSNAGNNSGLSASSISGPYSVTTDSSGNAYIADTNNNRVLYYPSGSTTATRVYGQPDFVSNSANRGGGPAANTLSGPAAVAVDSSGDVYIADLNNNRVLYYAGTSTTATRVYGQGGDLTTATGNKGGSVTAGTLSGPRGVVVDSSGDVYIADTNNNRVLYYAGTSTTATRVYGQSGDLTTAAGNKGGSVTAATLSGPFTVALDSSDNVYIADVNNNRVLYYAGTSTTATRVYGQGGDLTTAAGNKGGSVTAGTLSAPYSVAIDSSDNVYIADTNNNRVLFYSSSLTDATAVFGQQGSFASATGNSGGVSAESLSGPYSVAVDSGENLYVADTNNNRVLYFLR